MDEIRKRARKESTQAAKKVVGSRRVVGPASLLKKYALPGMYHDPTSAHTMIDYESKASEHEVRKHETHLTLTNQEVVKPRNHIVEGSERNNSKIQIDVPTQMTPYDYSADNRSGGLAMHQDMIEVHNVELDKMLVIGNGGKFKAKNKVCTPLLKTKKKPRHQVSEAGIPTLRNKNGLLNSNRKDKANRSFENPNAVPKAGNKLKLIVESLGPSMATFSKYRRSEFVEMEREKHQKAKLIQLAKQQVRKDRTWLFYLLALVGFIFVVGSALIGARNSINGHVETINEIFAVTVALCDSNYHISSGLIAYLSQKTQAYSTNRGFIKTSVADTLMANLSYTSDFYTDLNSTISSDVRAMGAQINKVKAYFSNSPNLREARLSDTAFKTGVIVYLNETSKSKGGVNPVFKLNMIQIMQLYREILKAQLILDPKKYDVFTQNMASFLVKKGFDVVMGSVNLMIAECIQTMKVYTFNYNFSFMIMLIMTSAIVLIIFGSWVGVMFFHRRWLGNIFNCFAVLTNKTLLAENARLNSLASFLESRLFQAQEKMMQVRKACANYMPHTLDNVHASLSKLPELKDLVREMDSGKQLKDSARELHMSYSSRFVYGRPLPVFWWLFGLNLLYLVFWGINLVIVLRIDSIVKDSNVIREVAIENLHLAIKLRTDFAKMTRICTFSTLNLSPAEMHEDLKSIGFSNHKNDYVAWWMNWRRNLQYKIGANNTLDQFQTFSLCTM